MAKLIVSVEQARARLQISQEIEPTSLVANIESAVSAAQHHVESIIESTLAEKTGQTAIFHLDKDSFSNVRPGGLFRLFLPTGLLKSVTVLVGDKWNLCINPVPSEDFTVNYEKGIVLVDELYADMFMKVTYDSGVNASTAPSWLEEVILSFVPIMFHLPATNTKSDPGVNFTELSKHADTVVNGHIRKSAFCLRPIK